MSCPTLSSPGHKAVPSPGHSVLAARGPAADQLQEQMSGSPSAPALDLAPSHWQPLHSRLPSPPLPPCLRKAGADAGRERWDCSLQVNMPPHQEGPHFRSCCQDNETSVEQGFGSPREERRGSDKGGAEGAHASPSRKECCAEDMEGCRARRDAGPPGSELPWQMDDSLSAKGGVRPVSWF